MKSHLKKLTAILSAFLLGLSYAAPLQAQNNTGNSGVKARFPSPTPENCALLYQIHCVKPTKNWEIRLFCTICNSDYEEF
jgi:hypothetical protein